MVAPYLTPMTPRAPQRVHDLREVFNGLRSMARAGADWRPLPHDFPPWQAVYQQTQRGYAPGGAYSVTATADAPTSRTRTLLAANAARALAMTFGGCAIVAARALGADVTPVTLGFLRNAIGGSLLLLFVALTAPSQLRVARRDLPWVALLGVVGFALYSVPTTTGLRHVEASRGGLLLATPPLFGVALARALKHERLMPRQLFGVALTLGGVVLTLVSHGSAPSNGDSPLPGDGLMLAGAACVTVFWVLTKRVIGRYAGFTVMAYAMLAGALLQLPGTLIEGGPSVLPHLSDRSLAPVFFVGSPGAGVQWALNTFAIAHLTPTQGLVYANLNAFVATVLGAAVLHERLTAGFGAAFLTVVAGVLLVNWPTGAARVVVAPPVAAEATT